MLFRKNGKPTYFLYDILTVAIAAFVIVFVVIL